MNLQTVADIEGPWIEPKWNSSLVERCKEAWNIPIVNLSNGSLAMLLRQQIAKDAILAEATRRLKAEFDDDTELFEGELALAVEELRTR